MQFTVHTAKSQLSRLIEAALAGEEVVIAKGARPVVRLVPIAQSGFRLGTQQGKLGPLPDFLEPQDAEDLDLWEGR
ncbi:type II toxin-antitoxin system prevent-host-death family antitoxin [Salipiger sp. P9]|uniref:type II toxin-antitoxin system Phd/YefM family antitoxin n=1 Tax=Salipiger pentaromativorans TaxID=2943193 RepID=UPI0021576969|nr:type II toxin-antitoxin system prevent-host-death family antitoxin [Salipiger pentaromativorans]MCR8550554.1 type II toxin-antitoxin system prevent-host-death family antitoxin [Salipiger pentaromativorans]